MLLPLMQNLAMLGGGAAPAAPATPAATPATKGHGKAGRARGRGLMRFVVEIGEDKHYFWSEPAAIAFLEEQGRRARRQAKAVARKTHRLSSMDRVLSPYVQPIPLPTIRPLPRFVVEGGNAISMVSQRINAQLDAILANPERDADLDDEDLMRLLND